MAAWDARGAAGAKGGLRLNPRARRITAALTLAGRTPSMGSSILSFLLTGIQIFDTIIVSYLTNVNTFYVYLWVILMIRPDARKKGCRADNNPASGLSKKPQCGFFDKLKPPLTRGLSALPTGRESLLAQLMCRARWTSLPPPPANDL
jgi:hypothetical protein